MYWGELVFVLGIALLGSALLVSGLGWRHPRSSSAPGAALFTFIVIALFVWAATIWVHPAGPVLWGVHWAPLAGVGLLTLLVLMALATPRLRRPDPQNPQSPDRTEAQIGRGLWAFGLVFWILMFAILGSALVGRAML